MITAMIEAGMDIARLNFSHGTQDDHAHAIDLIRRSSARLKRTVAILQDLQGPKIRAGKMAGGEVLLNNGAEVIITADAIEGTPERIPTTYKALATDVRPGDRILIDDGLIELRVTGKDGWDVECLVVKGGMIKDHKGINLPGVNVSAPSATEKDLDDLRFGLEAGVDYVALSFVRSAEDIDRLKEMIGRADVPVIAKLEKPEAIERLDEILRVADGVMVARGDLGVELPPERVPIIQKMIIERANRTRVPVITATQMLESMTMNPRPTRAEASDVANAILDGTDAVMLSGETAVGHYPVESVTMMARIAVEAERRILEGRVFRRRRDGEQYTFSDAIGDAACLAAHDLNAKAIVVFTQSGATARLISKYRPHVPIIAFTPAEQTLRRLCLYWGVTPKIMKEVVNTDRMVAAVEERLLSDKEVSPGDILVIVAGTPITAKGGTNFLKLHRVGG
jgi:pyruvate kinase